jgi:hypothetical protein
MPGSKYVTMKPYAMLAIILLVTTSVARQGRVEWPKTRSWYNTFLLLIQKFHKYIN